MEVLDNTGMKLLVFAALKEILVVKVCGYSFVLPHSVNVNALQIVFSNSSCESTAKWETCQIFQRTDGWCTFS